ncbi:MAG: hypothetical protein JJD92_11905 [Frankiaceae bacterium]|nr:hypothetical protein [Frankiaceae bacterium]
MRHSFRSAAAALIYLWLAALLHAPAFVDLADRTLCSCGDQPQTDWYLAWTPHAVFSGQAPWTTDHLLIPDGVNLMWNTLMPLPGLLMSPLTLLAGPMATHTILSVLAFAGSATAMWWVVRRWAPWWPARFAAGLLYGFSPYLVAQGSGHLNLELVIVPPLVLLVADELLVRQRRRAWVAGGVLGLIALAQLLTAEEILASTFLVALLGVLVLAWQHRPRIDRPRIRHAVIGLGTAAGLLSVGAAWPLWVQFFGKGTVTAPVQDASPYAADVLGLIVPTAHQLLGIVETSAWGVNDSENGSYLGLPLVMAVCLLAWRFRAIPVVRWAAALGLVSWVLSLGERLHFGGRLYDVPLPFDVVSQLPVLHNMAAVRLSLYVVLCAAVVVAVGLDRLHALGWFDRHRTGAAVLAVTCVLPLVPASAYSYVDAGTPPYFTSGAVNRVPANAVAYTYPVPRYPGSAPMEWQAQADFRYRSLGGYVISRGDGGGGTFAGRITVWERVVGQAAAGRRIEIPPAQVQRRLLQEMTELRVRAILVADVRGADDVNRLVEQLLGRPADEHTGRVSAWYVDAGPAAGPRRD